MKTRTILYADEGKVLTDGEVFGEVIFLSESQREDDYHEISREEYEQIVAEEASPV